MLNDARAGALHVRALCFCSRTSYSLANVVRHRFLAVQQLVKGMTNVLACVIVMLNCKLAMATLSSARASQI
jgi:hypothetical protein